MRNGKKLSLPRARGRPRGFDEAEVLAALTRSFWVHGFAAASLDDLAAAAGVNRPSLYAAFGNKQAMYLRAIASVAEQLDQALDRALGPPQLLLPGLAAFYRESIALYLSGDPGPRGCLVVCTATSAALDEPPIQSALADVLRRTDGAFERHLARARETGELTASADPRTLSLVASATLHSLAVRARAGESRARLQRLARATTALIAGFRSA